METFFRDTLSEEAFHHPPERIHDLVDRDGSLDPVPERRVRAEAAAETDVDGLDDLFADMGRLTTKADVGDLGLGARGGTARKVHPDDGVRTARTGSCRSAQALGVAAVHRLGPRNGTRLGLDDGEAAELAPCAGDHAALERGGKGREALQQILLEQVGDPVVSHPREHEVLIGAKTDLTVAIELGEARGLYEVLAGQAAHRDRAAHIAKPALALALHPDVIAPVSPRELVAGWAQLEGRSRGKLGPEGLRAELLDQVTHPGRPPVLPVAQLTEDLRDRPRDLDRLIGGDEHVDVAPHPRTVRETSPDEQVEADRAVVKARWPEADVVYLRLSAVLETAGDAELELAGQVGVLTIAREKLRDLPDDRGCVEGLVCIDARDRAAEDVAGGIAAGLHGGDPHLLEQRPDTRHIRDVDPVQLHVLARGEIAVAVTPDGAGLRRSGIAVDDLTDPAHLGGAQPAPGHLHPQHEGVAALALGIEADPLEALHLARDLGDGGWPREGVAVADGIGHLEGMAFELPALDLVQLRSVPVRTNEFHWITSPPPLPPAARSASAFGIGLSPTSPGYYT